MKWITIMLWAIFVPVILITCNFISLVWQFKLWKVDGKLVSYTDIYKCYAANSNDFKQ